MVDGGIKSWGRGARKENSTCKNKRGIFTRYLYFLHKVLDHLYNMYILTFFTFLQ